MTWIVGINAYHGDASACILRDGRLIAAAEEERFRRIKHWAGFPAQAIAYCLDAAGIGLAQVDRLAVNRDPRANFLRKVLYTLRKRPDIGLIAERLRNARKWGSIEGALHQAFPGSGFRGQVCHVEHHLSHLASAFFVSPFDTAVAVSVDGFGDFASAAWGVGRGGDISVDAKVYFPHSLGIFYQAMTQFLGFPHYGDEYKVMGLAAYGQPAFMKEMREVLHLDDDGTFQLNLAYFRHHQEKILYEWEGGEPVVGELFTARLGELLGPRRDKAEPVGQRHWDLARSVQSMYEEAFFHLLNQLHRRYVIDSLVLAGGCAMNSVANGRIYGNTPFKHVYIQSAAGDAGGAIGAAYAEWHRSSGATQHVVMDHAYWGPEFGDKDLATLVQENRGRIAAEGCTAEVAGSEDDLCRRTAQAVAEGKVVGWFHGRMEWGPRALGNRSIVCDPRRADMKNILNLKIKRRESFRPFAPSILREQVGDWFETDADVPFMMQVFQIREDKRAIIPAVTHVDGSGRLQTVHRDTNPRYYKLIEEFAGITGVPMVLNTSFNENEPVVCHPREALDCFLRTKMDLLVLGSHLITRR